MTIISYDLISKQPKFQAPYQVVICDESHYLKNQQAKRTQVICPLLRQARRAILLSGTPALNKPVELYQQIDALLPDFCCYREFAERYSQQVWNHFTRRFEYDGHQHVGELHALLVNTVMIRRLKQQVQTELPPKIRSRVPVEIGAKELREIKEKMAELMETDEDGSGRGSRDSLLPAGGAGAGSGSAAAAASEEEEQHGEADDDAEQLFGSRKGRSAAATASLVTELFTLTGLAKRPGICDYLSYLFHAQDEKILLFAHHRAVLDHLEDYLLKTEKKKLVRIDGQTPMEKREALVKEFQTNPSCKVALLSITACGHGLNLTAAGTVVFAELYWVPGQMIQAEDRSHRIGTEFSSVNVHYLIAEGTLDETVFRTLQRKWGTMTSTLDGQQQQLTLETRIRRPAASPSPSPATKKYKELDVIILPSSTSFHTNKSPEPEDTSLSLTGSTDLHACADIQGRRTTSGDSQTRSSDNAGSSYTESNHLYNTKCSRTGSPAKGSGCYRRGTGSSGGRNQGSCVQDTEALFSEKGGARTPERRRMRSSAYDTWDSTATQQQRLRQSGLKEERSESLVTIADEDEEFVCSDFELKDPS